MHVNEEHECKQCGTRMVRTYSNKETVEEFEALRQSIYERLVIKRITYSDDFASFFDVADAAARAYFKAAKRPGF